MAFGIDGLLIGHGEDRDGLTGCTAVPLPPGSKGGGDVRGGAPGTRETDLLESANLVESVNAFLLAGGTAFGLAAADGVMRYLEEQGIGFPTLVANVPIVPCGVIFDLAAGDAAARPDASMGYEACLNASDEPDQQGNAGAGMGATVGKVLGASSWMKSGVGMASLQREDGLKILALAIVNAVGDVIDENGTIIAGARDSKGKFLNTEAFLSSGRGLADGLLPGTNTTLGVIKTNGKLTKKDTNWVARQGHNGIARAIIPSHTKLDGDLIFTASTGQVEAQADVVGIMGARLMAEAIRNAVRPAESIAGI